MHGIGTHVGDQPDQVLVADLHAFVQALRQAHGAAGAEAELARGFLLQGRGDERGRRATLALLARDFGDLEHAVRRTHQFHPRSFSGSAVAEGELLDLVAVVAQQAGIEGLHRMRALRRDRPVLLRLERLDLFLALDDQAQRRRLHTAGGQPGLDLAPQHRAEVEADQVIERAPRLLRIDQIKLQFARMRDCFLDRLRRDFGEHHPVQRASFEQAALAQDLADVPADRLALAIQVGCEVEGISLLGGLGDRLDVPLVLLDQFVAHGEIAIGIDRALAWHQIAHMAIGGEDMKVLAEVFVDRLGLGGRLDDEQVLGHSPSAPQDRCGRLWVRCFGPVTVVLTARPGRRARGASLFQ